MKGDLKNGYFDYEEALRMINEIEASSIYEYSLGELEAIFDELGGEMVHTVDAESGTYTMIFLNNMPNNVNMYLVVYADLEDVNSNLTTVLYKSVNNSVYNMDSLHAERIELYGDYAEYVDRETYTVTSDIREETYQVIVTPLVDPVYDTVTGYEIDFCIETSEGLKVYSKQIN